ncbi:hypothetical protein ACT3UD_17435 [Glutamicibacter sp. 287]|nr:MULTISPECIES: hypothetical protein [Glutamicibacter]
MARHIAEFIDDQQKGKMMLDYETRLKAALRSLGASPEVVQDALLSLQSYGSKEDQLVEEFGEPEEYANALMPDAKVRSKAGFIISGVVLAVLIWLVLRLAKEAEWMAFEPYWNFSLLFSLGAVVLGIGIEFIRYLRSGK